jgi:hypothetical protein
MMHQMSQATRDWLNERLGFLADAKAKLAKAQRARDREEIFIGRVMEGVKYAAAIVLIFELFVRPIFQWLST